MLKSFIKLCKECLTMLKLQKMFFLLITIIMMNINISFAEKISMPYLYNDTNYVRIHEDSWAAYYLLLDSVRIDPWTEEMKSKAKMKSGHGVASVLYDVFASSVDGPKIKTTYNIISIDLNNQYNYTFYYRDKSSGWIEVDDNMDKIELESCSAIVRNDNYNDSIRNGRFVKGQRHNLHRR